MLRDVILNLGMSAADAIGQDRGTITVRIRPRPIGSVTTGPGTRSGDARWAELTINDTAASFDDGSPADEFDVWNPAAYSDDGRNRGLSVIHGIVTEFGGEVSVSSDPESGTTVTILLPLCRAPTIECEETNPQA
jgi:signal transduction histidine kinase